MAADRADKKGDGVKSQVDTLLRLVPIPEFEARPRDCRRVRAIQRGGVERVTRDDPAESDVVKELNSWRRGNPKEYAQIEAGLRLMAEHEDVPYGAGVRPCRNAPGIIEVKAGKRRLYCFLSPDTQETVIAAVTQSVNKGNNQDAAIQVAAARLQEWKDGIPHPDLEDVRMKLS
jgi:hypothetical protein